MLSQGIVVLGIVLALVAIQASRAILRARLSPLKKVPGPFLARYTRLWELLSVVRGKLHRETVELHQKFGPVVRIGPNKYCFDSAEAVKTIYSMSGSFPKSSYYDAFAEPGTERALFNSRNAQHHAHLRRTQASLYSMTTIKSYEPFVDTQTAILEQKFKEFAKTNQVVSLPDFLQKYAFDVIGEMTFGESFHLMENSIDMVGMIDLLDKSFIISAAMGVFPELWTPLVGLLKLLRLPSPKVLYDVALKFLNQYKASGKAIDEADEASPATFTAKVVALQENSKMTSWEALSVGVNNVIAGSDTTAISVNSALYHIYTIPRVLERLRNEIDSFAERGEISEPITFAEAQKLPFLQAVISEALRVHPAVGVPLVREVPQGGAHISGYFFPGGTEVGVNAWGLNHNKNVYGPDAQHFRPERWFENSLGTTSSAINQFAFGGGSRTCIGKNISMLEMFKVIPQIVRKWDVNVDKKTLPWELSTYWFVKQRYNSHIQLRTEEKE